MDIVVVVVVVLVGWWISSRIKTEVLGSSEGHVVSRIPIGDFQGLYVIMSGLSGISQIRVPEERLAEESNIVH